MVIEGGKVYVSLAHRYWNAEWDLARNRAVYGRDVSREGLGANLRLEAYVEVAEGEACGAFQPALEELKTSVDHRSLFDDVAEFTTRPSTLETIAEYLARSLFQRPLTSGRWHSLQVWESDDFAAVVYSGAKEMQLKRKVRNLWLTLQGSVDSQSGLLCSRDRIDAGVERAFSQLGDQPRADLGSWLFSSLATGLPELAEVRIDLARHSFHSVGRQDLIV